MKRFLIFIALAEALVLSSCATKGHCDAYGNKSGYLEDDSIQSV